MKKNFTKALAIALSIIMVIACAPLAFASESTTEIASADDFYAFAQLVNAGESADAVLTADITVDETFEPVGTPDHPYSGSFDGNGYTISGEYYSSEDYAGLFGYTDGATVCNLTVADFSFDSYKDDDSAEFSGGLIAHAVNTSITSVTVSASVYGNNYTGGIVGYAGDCVITDCETTSSCYIGGSVKYSGGIVGLANGTEISSCSNNAYLDCADVTGGIAGQAENNTAITECENAAATVNGAARVAGIAGVLVSSAISSCFNKASIISTDNYVAGIAAVIKNGTVENCGNIGAVSAPEASCFAGVFGQLTGGSVSTSFNTGRVSGASKTYAGVGSSVAGTVTNCYALDSAQKLFHSVAGAKITGCSLLADKAMKTETAYEGFDFEEIWVINPAHGSDYPVLRAVSKHTLQWMATTDPTCTENGFSTYICTVCSELVQQDVVPATGHTNEVVEEVLPTCTEGGHTNYVCTVCQAETTEEIEAPGHIDADENGKCDVCDLRISGEEPVERSVFEIIADFFRGIFNWIKSLFTK